MKKILALVLTIVLVMTATIAGTLAWLQDSTDEVVNTFTVGKVDIDLTESTGDKYKVSPGDDVAKDPTVTVYANSEACWLFVEVTETDLAANKITWAIADGWTALPDVAGVYYRAQDAIPADGTAASYSVLKGDHVLVGSDLGELTGTPSLTFKAYAIQSENLDTPAAAWAALNG